MREIAPGVFHWTTFHEGIESRVSSYYVTDARSKLRCLVDPRVPEQGLEWFRQGGGPTHALLTNRHHYRHSGQFESEFATRVHCHSAGLHEFEKGERVEPFEHGEIVAPGVKAIEVGSLCPEETAFHFAKKGIVALGDSVVRWRRLRGALSFVPDELMGDDPETVKLGLRDALSRLIDLEWDTLLLAHGEPLVGDGKRALERFLVSRRGRRAA